ncbi:MAG: bifunctional 3-(3-hydroxy-phenyl)propionate/3-hydroxycinnamic acid hydroxylase [Pseudomonas sp.]
MSNNGLNVLPAAVDVLVVGNGPVGATLAALLGRHGISTLVVDKAHEVLLMPRAIALDNEALRILQMAGLAEQAFAKIVIPQVRMHCPIVGQFGRANTSGSLDGHPKLVTFYQPDLEHAMRAQYQRFACVKSLGGYALQTFTQDAEGVQAQLLDDAGQLHSVQARYLVGADGASSRVRSLIGQDFKGQTYSEDWLIVDVAEREQQAIDHVEFICDHRRPTPHMPAPGGRERWEFMLQAGETREQMESDQRITELLSRWVPAHELKVERKAVYRFHARCCERFQQGRVFLVGDAAHITPPFVGQGLVAGLRDVANLSWKLAWVLKGRAAASILDSYDQERRPHAKEMIALAKFMGRLVMPSNAIKAFIGHGLMRSLRLVPPLRRLFEELDIKPKNIFKQGLFLPARRGRRLRRGGLLGQGWVRDAHGHLALSDEMLGDSLTLVGFGVDPCALLSPQEQRRWEACGGSYLQIGLHGQKGQTATRFIEDLGHTLLGAAPTGSLAIVRPDRIVMHEGQAGEAGTLVQECLRLFGQ